MKSFSLRASTDGIEEAEGMTGEFVLTAGHLAYEALSKKVILDLGAAMTAAAERMEELAKLREGLVALIEERKHPRYGAGHGAIYVQELERLLGGSK